VRVGSRPVEQRIGETDRRLALARQQLVEPRDQCSVQRSDRACSPEDKLLPVHADVVASLRISVAGDVGHAAAGVSIVGRSGDVSVGLIGWRWERCAYPTPRGPAARSVIPNDFVLNLPAGAGHTGAATADNIRARSRKIDMQFPVLHAIGRAVVAGCYKDRHIKRSGILEHLIHSLACLRTPVRLG
jgi:hypothetical protein